MSSISLNTTLSFDTGWHPYNMMAVDDGNDGLIYDYAVDGAVAYVETPLFEDGYEYMMRWEGTSGTSSAVQSLSVYRETDSAWSVIAQSPSNAIYVRTGYAQLIMPRLPSYVHEARIKSPSVYSDNSSWNIVLGDYSVWDATIQKISKAKYIAGGNFDAGKVFLDRKREYISV